ncbi:gp52 [Synechococcus phage Syn5]|uniref:Gp52 n=1 Tax=Synechococcus phage Syn5 TaxID=2914003 RepID=A4ZRD3_9CAUD|nr:gp52 [Synechococcus phage Syn5]ABP87959.1 gp52 [Synechococcus phage Syn5]
MSFPSNPALGDQYNTLGSTYEWYGPGTGWQRVTTSAVSSYQFGLDLDDVRTDSGDTSLTYTNGQLTQVSRPGVVKDLTYNGDGTLNTLTITTDTETVTKTFGYSSGILNSITVS